MLTLCLEFIRAKSLFLYQYKFKAMNDKPKKDTVIIARINSKLKRAIENAAKQNGQTVTGYIEKLVENDLRAKFEPIS